MAGPNDFTSQFISSTFQRLLQLSGSGEVTDGTGSLVSFLPLSVNNALTASYVPGVTATTPGGGLWAIQFNSASTFQGSNNLLFVSPASTLVLTGSISLSGSAAIQGVNYIDFLLLDQANHPTHQEGRVHWYDDTKTLNVDTDVNNFYIELGHQNVIRVRNENPFTLTKGKIVYINGEAGNKPTVATASWTGDQTSAATIGWVVQDIGSSNTGYILTNGILRDVNTNAYAPGTMLYLSSSGNWTSTPPDAPLHEVRLGQVITQAAAGTIYVNIMNGYELTELHDVKTTSYSAGDLLIQSNSLWINSKQLTGSYGLTGSLTIVNGGVTGSLFGTASYADRAFRTTEIGDDFYQIDVFEVGYALSQTSTDTVTLLNIQSNTISTITIDNVANAGFASIANFAYSTTTAETSSYVNTLNQTVIVSGSVDISGSLFLNGVAIGGAGAETDPVYTAQKPTLATTGSNIFKGEQYVTGSVYITGSFGLTSYGNVEPINPPAQVGLFYFTDTNLFISLQ